MTFFKSTTNFKKSFQGLPLENGSTFLKPEDLSIGAWYSITINPPDDDYLDYSDQATKFDTFLQSLNSTYIMYPELSKIGRLHYHGVVMFRDPLALIFDQRKISKGYQCHIQEVNDLSKWLLYCVKNLETLSLYENEYSESAFHGINKIYYTY